VVSEPTLEHLRSGLEAVGLAVDDTRVLLRAVARDPGASSMALAGALRKRSRNGRVHALSTFRRRYASPSRGLAPPASVLAGLDARIGDEARAQLLLPYVLLTDRLAWEIVIDLVLPRLGAGDASLTGPDVEGHVAVVFERHGRRGWGQATRRRWAQGLLSVLREIGALGRNRDRERLLPYSVKVEAFTFHLWGLYAAGLRGDGLLVTPFWRALCLTPDGARSLLRDAVGHGWWRSRLVAGVLETYPLHESLDAWIADGLG
jgi:hypothetical protein